MATWNSGDETAHPLDFRMVKNSFVTMFWRSSVLAGSVHYLREHGYNVVDMRAASWMSAEAMVEDVAVHLDFPDYFGRNLDALNDCMGDVASGDFGWRAEATGLVLVFPGFDAFHRQDPVSAYALLDITARNARSAMLIGHRLLCLVQSDDPRLTLQAVGATPIVWNDEEWRDVQRGL